jgi:hypothetical protein
LFLNISRERNEFEVSVAFSMASLQEIHIQKPHWKQTVAARPVLATLASGAARLLASFAIGALVDAMTCNNFIWRIVARLR